MADFEVRSISAASGSDGLAAAARLNKRQELVAMPWLVQLGLDGKLYIANRGTASTPVDFSKTAYDEDQPQLAVTVPEGTTILPVFLQVILEDSAGTDTEAIWSFTTNSIGAGTSTAVTPVNTKRGGAGSSCSVYRDYTGNATAATGLTEFARFTYAFADEADVNGRFPTVNGLDRPQWLKGAATLQLHVVAGTTSAQGFVIALWAEFSTSELGI